MNQEYTPSNSTGTMIASVLTLSKCFYFFGTRVNPSTRLDSTTNNRRRPRTGALKRRKKIVVRFLKKQDIWKKDKESTYIEGSKNGVLDITPACSCKQPFWVKYMCRRTKQKKQTMYQEFWGKQHNFSLLSG